MPLRARAARMSVLVGVLGALTLTACGSTDTSAPAPTVASATAPSESAAASSETSGSRTSSARSAGEESSAEGSSTEEPEVSTAEASGAGAAGSSGSESDCPIGTDDLAAVTGLSWQFVISEADHPSEVYAGVVTDVCGFTAPEVVDEYGDPAFMRIDVYSGADVATRQEGYATTCTSIGGTLTTGPVSGGVFCTKDGVAVDGQVGGGDRLVELWINSGGDATARFSAVFDQILAAMN